MKKFRVNFAIMQDSGFTLSEILVVVGLLGIVIVFVAGILISNYRLYDNQSGKIMAVNSARSAGDKIVEFARFSDGIAESHVFGTNTYSTGEETVIYKMSAIDSGGDLIVGSYDFVIITKDPGNSSRLIMIVDPDVASSRKSRVLEFTDGLNSISFSYDDPDPVLARNIQFEISITKGVRNPSIEIINGSATLRN